MPVVDGPGGSEPDLAQALERFGQTLQPAGLKIAELVLSDRRAWRMKLDNGLELELGRDEVGPRLDRFVAIWRQELSRLPYRMEYVDLRYPNGFAVKMPDYVPGRQPARPAA